MADQYNSQIAYLNFRLLKRTAKRLLLSLMQVVLSSQRLKPLSMRILENYPNIKEKLRTIAQNNNIVAPFYQVDAKVLNILRRGRIYFSKPDTMVRNTSDYVTNARRHCDVSKKQELDSWAIEKTYIDEISRLRFYMDVLSKLEGKDF